jgi:hypothetical protein
MWYNPWAPPIFPARRPEPLPLPTYPWGVGPPIFPPINDVNQPAQALQAGPPALQLPGQMRRADGGPSAAEQTIEDARHQIATQSQRLPPAAPDYGPDVDWSRYNQPTGELKAATYSPTQRIGNAMADALMAAGMPPYTANDLTHRVGNVLNLFPPVAVAGSAMDAIHAKASHDDVGALTAMVGLIPGVRPGVQAVEQGIRAASGEIRSGINGAQQASGLFDLSRLHEVPNVPQFDLPRYAPPRGIPTRVLDVNER